MKFFYKGEDIFNVPNIISFYRLVTFPLILILGIFGYEQWFIVLLCINLVSDIVDGFIARTFNVVTRFGAAVDNLADIGTYILALFGLFAFKWQEVQPHAWLLYTFLSIFVISYIVAFARFGKVPGLHLYSAVAAGYLQGAFFFVLFAWDFYLWFYYLAVGWGAIAYTEKILVLLNADEIRPGLKGLYWVMQNKKQAT